MAQPTARPLKIGLLLPIEENGEGNAVCWTDLKCMAQHAEAVGFDSLWVPDHLIYDFAAIAGISGVPPWGMWECWSILSSLAAVTTRVELGTIVACTGFRNPALLAKMADTVDEISNGRLILGLGAGYHETEFRAFGYPFDHLVGRFDEALQIVHSLLRKGAIDFQGKYYSARGCELRPRGPRRNGAPILIGARQPHMLRLTAQYADYWNGPFVNQAESLTPVQAAVDAACVTVGRDPATLQRTVLIMIDLPGSYLGPDADAYRRFRMRTPPATGTPEELAELLRAVARGGVSHVQLWLEPNTMDAIDVFAPVLELLDQG